MLHLIFLSKCFEYFDIYKGEELFCDISSQQLSNLLTYLEKSTSTEKMKVTKNQIFQSYKTSSICKNYDF